MKKYIMAGIFFAATMLVSCGGLQSFTFDQLYPAAVTFPEQVRMVAVVNHAPSIPSPKKNLLTLGKLDGDGKVLSESLAGGLADSRYFHQVVISDSAITQELTEGEILSQPVVDSLARALGVDLILSVDRIQLLTEKEDIYYPGLMTPFAAFDLKIHPTLRAYVPSRAVPLATISKIDSMSWDLNSALSDYDVVNEASRHAGFTLVNQLVPHWKNVERIYFDGGNPDMRDAAVSLREGDWQEAGRLWENLYNSLKKGKLKSRAAFNMALACEVQGLMNEAVAWIEKAATCASKGSEEERVIALYSMVLQERAKDFRLLNLQMARFGNKFN